jgi:hypothetical protein
MSEYDTGYEHTIPVETPLEKLREELQSAELDSLTRRRTPLTRARLKAEVPRLYDGFVHEYTSDDDERGEFQTVYEDLDWPQDSDAPMSPPHLYRSNEEFEHFLTERSGSMDAGGLNNFVTHFMTDVHILGDEVDVSSGLHRMYAASPHLIRAHAVAPRFFDALTEVISEIEPFERERFYRTNPMVVDALHKAYALTGRLVKPDAVITDVHHTLVQ